MLQLLGGLDLPTSGSREHPRSAINELSDAARGDLRNRALGFVYQFHHLLPEFTALENVAMPLLIRRTPVQEARDTAHGSCSDVSDWRRVSIIGPGSYPVANVSVRRWRAHS